MKSIRMNLRNVAISFACLAVTTVFVSCDDADEPSPNAPAFVEFSFANQRGTSDIDAKKRTVKAVAECGTNIASLAPAFKLSPEGITATVDGKAQESGKTANDFADAVVYTLATPDGETAEWTVTITLPDDCPQVKKYITYNKPVTAYFIEYNGGAIVANQNSRAGNYGVVLAAYENRKSAEVTWEDDHFDCDVTLPNGDWLFTWDGFGGTEWMLDKVNNNDEWPNLPYVHAEYPLSCFAAMVSQWKDYGGFVWQSGSFDNLTQILDRSDFVMPNHTDVTEYYLRSEKVMDIMCDVYKISDIYGVVKTFWVDPATGFTLKLENKDLQGNLDDGTSYEVTRLVVGTPDWDGEHLHPRSTDTVKEP